MPESAQSLVAFQQYLSEFARDWYAGDETRAFKHVAFKAVAPGPLPPDEQIREMTGISRPGEIEICGWSIDAINRTFMLFQATGWNTKVDDEKLALFWRFPEQALSPAWREGPGHEAAEPARQLEQALREGDVIRMVFASRGGYTPAALDFARPLADVERELALASGSAVRARFTLELLDEDAVAARFSASRER
jgi:hypothetical protein